jgi:hypothetical protein
MCFFVLQVPKLFKQLFFERAKTKKFANEHKQEATSLQTSSCEGPPYNRRKKTQNHQLW